MKQRTKDVLKELLKLFLCLIVPVTCELVFQGEYFPDAGEFTGHKIYIGMIVGGAVWLISGCFRGLVRRTK